MRSLFMGYRPNRAGRMQARRRGGCLYPAQPAQPALRYRQDAARPPGRHSTRGREASGCGNPPPARPGRARSRLNTAAPRGIAVGSGPRRATRAQDGVPRPPRLASPCAAIRVFPRDFFRRRVARGWGWVPQHASGQCLLTLSLPGGVRPGQGSRPYDCGSDQGSGTTGPADLLPRSSHLRRCKGGSRLAGQSYTICRFTGAL